MVTKPWYCNINGYLYVITDISVLKKYDNIFMMIKLEKIKLKQALSLNFQFWMHSQWGSNFLEENQITRMRVCEKDPIEEIQILVKAENTTVWVVL